MSIAGGGKEEKIKKLEEVFQEVARNIAIRVYHGSDEKLTHPQFFMLKKLRNGPATVSEVADYLGVSLSAITAMADRLVKTKYITRCRSEDDRRLVWLELTDTGREMLNKAAERNRELIHGLLNKLPEEDLEAMYGIYTRLLGLITE
ncbi:MAG: MarR family transcriptional regulator [Firmicutes bacterium]|nr:MarR family transcriptional regulator [Bacillota bacterium]